MPLIAKESGKDFPPIQGGTKGARCFGVVGLGTQVSDNPKYRPSERVLLMFEVPEETYEFEGKEVPMTILREYPQSLGRKTKPTNLRKDLDSWRGKPFTEQEAAGFDLKNLLGVPCILSILNYTKQNGSPGAKITGISALPKNYEVPALAREPVYYDVSLGKGKEYQALPEWMQKKVASCLEFNPEAVVQAPEQIGATAEDTVDDDVPFSFILPWLTIGTAAASALIA